MFGTLKRAFSEFEEDDGTVRAAALAYCGVLSLFPARAAYNQNYGTLGGVVALPVWMWITNIAVVFGQQLSAQRRRGGLLERGKPAEERIQLPLRGEPKESQLTDTGHVGYAAPRGLRAT